MRLAVGKDIDKHQLVGLTSTGASALYSETAYSGVVAAVLAVDIEMLLDAGTADAGHDDVAIGVVASPRLPTLNELDAFSTFHFNNLEAAGDRLSTTVTFGAITRYAAEAKAQAQYPNHSIDFATT